MRSPTEASFSPRTVGNWDFFFFFNVQAVSQTQFLWWHYDTWDKNKKWLVCDFILSFKMCISRYFDFRLERIFVKQNRMPVFYSSLVDFSWVHLSLNRSFKWFRGFFMVCSAIHIFKRWTQMHSFLGLYLKCCPTFGKYFILH